MTLFETLPQFTMFVLFFMLGFVTRFFAQITFMLCGTVFRIVGKRFILIWRKIVLAVKKTAQKSINNAKRKEEKRLSDKNANIIKQGKSQATANANLISESATEKKNRIAPLKKAISARFEQKQHGDYGVIVGREVLGDRVKGKKINAFAWVDLIYFAFIGILTLKVFAMFEFIEFFWFIPFSVILGVAIHDYLTKEVFAKRKKI